MSSLERRPRIGRRPPAWTVVAAAVVVALALVPSALAYHRASGSTRKAMKAALSERDCGEPHVKLAEAFVSSADPHYGLAYCGYEGHFGNILQRSGGNPGHWHIVFQIGDGIQSCSALREPVPQAVLRDLRIGGLKKGGAEGIC